MKCPRCGAEMTLDEHRKYGLYMCYECGYMEGRNLGEIEKKPTNLEQMKTVEDDKLAAFIANGLGLSEEKVAAWLSSSEE